MAKSREMLEQQWEVDLREELNRQQSRLREQIQEKLCQHVDKLIARMMPADRTEENPDLGSQPVYE